MEPSSALQGNASQGSSSRCKAGRTGALVGQKAEQQLAAGLYRAVHAVGGQRCGHAARRQQHDLRIKHILRQRLWRALLMAGESVSGRASAGLSRRQQLTARHTSPWRRASAAQAASPQGGWQAASSGRKVQCNHGPACCALMTEPNGKCQPRRHSSIEYCGSWVRRGQRRSKSLLSHSATEIVATALD